MHKIAELEEISRGKIFSFYRSFFYQVFSFLFFIIFIFFQRAETSTES